MKIQRQRLSGFGNKKRNTASCCLFSLLLLPWFFDIEFSLSSSAKKYQRKSYNKDNTQELFSFSRERVRAGPSVVVIVVVLWTKKTTISSFFASYTLKKLFSSLLFYFFCLTNRKEKRDNDGWGRENGKTHKQEEADTFGTQKEKERSSFLFFSCFNCSSLETLWIYTSAMVCITLFLYHHLWVLEKMNEFFLLVNFLPLSTVIFYSPLLWSDSSFLPLFFSLAFCLTAALSHFLLLRVYLSIYLCVLFSALSEKKKYEKERKTRQKKRKSLDCAWCVWLERKSS